MPTAKKQRAPIWEGWQVVSDFICPSWCAIERDEHEEPADGFHDASQCPYCDR